MSACGWVLGLGLGSWLGFLVLGLRPRWPLSEDLDRFLALVFPAFLGVEVLIAILRWSPCPSWLARGLVAAPGRAGAALRVELPERRRRAGDARVAARRGRPDPRRLALALVGSWYVVEAASRRGSAGSVVLALALSTGGAAVALLLSGYASGGQMGLPVAAALGGLAVAMPFVPGKSLPAVPVGPGLGALFSLLVIGRFFASLTTAHAVLLFLAPLLGAAVVLLLPRRWGPGSASPSACFRSWSSWSESSFQPGRDSRPPAGLRRVPRGLPSKTTASSNRPPPPRAPAKHLRHPPNRSQTRWTLSALDLRRRRLHGRARLLPSGLVLRLPEVSGTIDRPRHRHLAPRWVRFLSR